MEIKQRYLGKRPYVPKNVPLGAIKLNDIHLHIEKETGVEDVELPSYAVEDGIEMTDHVQQKAKVLSISGKLFGDTKHSVEDKLKLLEHYKVRGTLMPYNGRIAYANMAIEKFSINASADIANGYELNMTLREIRVGKKRSNPTNPSAKDKQTVGVQGASQGQYHVTKAGDTYIGLGKKYGTDWRDIKKWASYPDTKIPVGVKVRVK